MNDRKNLPFLCQHMECKFACTCARSLERTIRLHFCNVTTKAICNIFKGKLENPENVFPAVG